MPRVPRTGGVGHSCSRAKFCDTTAEGGVVAPVRGYVERFSLTRLALVMRPPLPLSIPGRALILLVLAILAGGALALVMRSRHARQEEAGRAARWAFADLAGCITEARRGRLRCDQGEDAGASEGERVPLVPPCTRCRIATEALLGVLDGGDLRPTPGAGFRDAVGALHAALERGLPLPAQKAEQVLRDGRVAGLAAR